jgi:hypothetical protein
MPKILYHFPSRERPYKFFNAVDNIISMSRHDDYLILASLDINDPTMNNAEVKSKLDSYGTKLKPVYGTSLNKVHAVNRDVWMEDGWDILITHSDDFWIDFPGFDLEVIAEFEKGFRGLLHFPDANVGNRLVTYPIMHVDYYKKFNYVYHPSYQSVYCDNHQMEVAILLGQYKYIDRHFLTHRHHIWGYGPADDLLKRTEHPVVYSLDYQTYMKMKENNFGLSGITK